jgi:hypothetical protein
MSIDLQRNFLLIWISRRQFAALAYRLYSVLDRLQVKVGDPDDPWRVSDHLFRRQSTFFDEAAHHSIAYLYSLLNARFHGR